MNSHITIRAKGKDRVLSDDLSLSVEFQNPMWNDTEMFSYPVDLPFDGNRDMLKNVDDAQSDVRPITLEHEPMQIIVDGVPFASGPMVISEDEELTDGLSVNVDSAVESFDSMISDLNCNDVPIPESDWPSLIIGEKISDVTVEMQYKFYVYIYIKGRSESTDYKKYFPAQNASATFEPQALGFSYPGKCKTTGNMQVAKKKKDVVYRDGTKVTEPDEEESYINVTDAYLANARGSSMGPAKFCNARVCYKHYDKDADGTTSDSVVKFDDGKGGPEDFGTYWVLDAKRPQSGICFYVLYFLECLFKHLNVAYDIDVLKNIEDMRHLCFFTTKCSYRTSDPLFVDSYTDEQGNKAFHPFFTHTVGTKDGNKGVTDSERQKLFQEVNEWLSSRGCGGQLELEKPEGVEINEFTLYPGEFWETQYKLGENANKIQIRPTMLYAKATAQIRHMIADEGNFPKMSVSSLLESLENMFGIKFDYDYERRKVTAYLYRDVLQTALKPRKLHAQVNSIHKVTEKITGVRIGYSAESDTKEQKDNIKNEVKDYDTAYNYIDYPDPATADKAKTTIIDKHYIDIFKNPNHGDMNVYIDQRTGNAYRIKVDKEASEATDMHPVLFEVGQFKGVEEGDCSTRNKDFVYEYMSDLVPVQFNDVNYQREKNYVETGGKLTTTDGIKVETINASAKTPLFAAYVDEDMEHEFIEQRIRQNLAGDYVNAYLTEVLTCKESYDPTKTDDGNSPLQSYDWDNAIAMMRGGGGEATYEQYDSDYDGFGNNKWRMKAAEYALESDSIGPFGELYDYNGISAGGLGEHFSLKPRAYKQPSWADAPLCEADRYEEGEHIRIQSRGYVDTFLKEFIYFLLNRKKYRIKCLASVAQIADIPNHWKEWWLIAGKKCLINRVSTDISVTDGMGEVELEVYSL